LVSSLGFCPSPKRVGSVFEHFPPVPTLFAGFQSDPVALTRAGITPNEPQYYSRTEFFPGPATLEPKTNFLESLFSLANLISPLSATNPPKTFSQTRPYGRHHNHPLPKSLVFWAEAIPQGEKGNIYVFSPGYLCVRSLGKWVGSLLLREKPGLPDLCLLGSRALPGPCSPESFPPLVRFYSLWAPIMSCLQMSSTNLFVPQTTPLGSCLGPFFLLNTSIFF